MSSVGKGTRWVARVGEWLGAQGFAVSRTRWMEPGDDLQAARGELNLSVEAKNQRALQLAGWVDQAERNAADGAIPVVIAHRLGHTQPGRAYVVMSGDAFARLVKVVERQ